VRCLRASQVWLSSRDGSQRGGLFYVGERGRQASLGRESDRSAFSLRYCHPSGCYLSRSKLYQPLMTCQGIEGRIRLPGAESCLQFNPSRVWTLHAQRYSTDERRTR